MDLFVAMPNKNSQRRLQTVPGQTFFRARSACFVCSRAVPAVTTTCDEITALLRLDTF